jgi:hypothetical protein
LPQTHSVGAVALAGWPATTFSGGAWVCVAVGF